MPTQLRNGQRDRDVSGRHRAEEADDVFETLRSANRDAVTRRPARSQLRGDYLRVLVDLRPGQRLGTPGGVKFVVDERVSGRVRMAPGLFTQHRGNRRLTLGQSGHLSPVFVRAPEGTR